MFRLPCGFTRHFYFRLFLCAVVHLLVRNSAYFVWGVAGTYFSYSSEKADKRGLRKGRTVAHAIGRGADEKASERGIRGASIGYTTAKEAEAHQNH